MADYWSNKFSLATGECLTSLGVIPANIRTNFASPETRMIVLPDAENRTIVSSFVWGKHRNVTDGQTDRRTGRIPVASTAVCIASNADAL